MPPHLAFDRRCRHRVILAALGAQVGYNLQAGWGVLGAELEGSYINNEVPVLDGKVETRFRGAAKAKSGLGFARIMVYGTAGVTTTQFEGNRRASGADKWKSVPNNWKQGYLLEPDSKRFQRYPYLAKRRVRTRMWA
ncbi:outer membrane protein, partial [Rhizobium johnstonii]|uniref:outer membrane protein n=1 Tax=Rhizobium johnstonii TaxID=3019933 RepID=UPI003F9CB8F9